MNHIASTSVSRRCAKCKLRGAALCRAVAADAKHPFSPRPLRFEPNSMLLEEGDVPAWIGVLRSGYLRQEKLSQDGRRTLLDLVVPGDIVGGFPGRAATCSLEAATEAEICVFDPEVVRREMRENGSFRLFLLMEASERVERQRTLTWRRGALTSRERIIAFIMMAAEIMPVEKQPDGSIVVTIELSRLDWADLTDTSVESISRTMGQLAERGLVENLAKGRYRIRDLDLLASMAGIDADHDRLWQPERLHDEMSRCADAWNLPPLTAINAGDAESPRVVRLGDRVAKGAAPFSCEGKDRDEHGQSRRGDHRR